MTKNAQQMRRRYPRDKHRQKNIETGRREKKKQTENQKSASDMGRDTNSLSVNTDTNHKGIKTHQYILFFCCSCKRHNHLQSGRPHLLKQRNHRNSFHIRGQKHQDGFFRQGAFALTSELQAEWEVFRTVICCDLGHDEGFDDDTGH